MNVISLESKCDETFPCIFNAKKRTRKMGTNEFIEKNYNGKVQMNCVIRTIGNVN